MGKIGHKFTATTMKMLKSKQLQNVRPRTDLRCWVKILYFRGKEIRESRLDKAPRLYQSLGALSNKFYRKNLSIIHALGQ